MMELISSQKALEIILDNTQDFGVEEILFLDSLGRILKEEILADRDFPPFDRVSMDGIAIKYDTYLGGKRKYDITSVQAAGSEQLTLENSEDCLEVMTGATLPKNADTVIRYEDITIKNGEAIINIETVSRGQNIHLKGKDRKQDAVLVKKNAIISAGEIGVLATVGKTMVKVAKQPKAIIISTGDELVNVNEVPLPHQIRKSNVFTLVSILQYLKIQAEVDHIKDDKSKLKVKIAEYLEDYDVLLFSGAVSKGKFDFLPEVLEELGVQKLFHKVAQRPGKPFWFGVKDASVISERRGKSNLKNASVFAFPGNPVSTFVGCLKYFYPWYYKSVEFRYELPTAELTEDFIFKPELTYFLQVKLSDKNGKLFAKPVIGNGSGDLANLADADGFLELPTNQTDFKKGESYPIIKYRN